MTQHMHKCLVDYLEISCAQGYVMCLQEGQHPQTGQRTANFRLLANQ